MMSKAERVLVVMYFIVLGVCVVMICIGIAAHHTKERPLSRIRPLLSNLPATASQERLVDPPVAARSGSVKEEKAGSGEENIKKPTPTGNANDVTSDRSHGARDIESSVAGQVQHPVTNQSIPHLAAPTENVVQPGNDTGSCTHAGGWTTCVSDSTGEVVDRHLTLPCELSKEPCPSGRIIFAAPSSIVLCHSLVINSGAPFGATSVTVAHQPDIGALIAKDAPIVEGKFSVTLCVPERSSGQYQVDATFHPKGEPVRAIRHEFAVQVGAKQ